MLKWLGWFMYFLVVAHREKKMFILLFKNVENDIEIKIMNSNCIQGELTDFCVSKIVSAFLQIWIKNHLESLVRHIVELI